MGQYTWFRHNGEVDLRQRISKAVQALASDAQTLLVAVSGGPDSVALLRLLQGSEYGLHVAHFDHALRADSAEDAAFVGALAASLSLPFYTGCADVAKIASEKGWNVEDAARRLRYSFLTRTAKRVGVDVVVTGHTRDDQAETVVMQLVRGAASAAGMAARRGRIVRPLLDTSRAELLDFLQEIDQPTRLDPTNLGLSYTRAWIRGEVLPGLEARYPKVKEKLAQFAALQRDQLLFLERAGERFFQNEGAEVAQLSTADVALQRGVIASLLARAEIPADTAHIEEIRRRLSSPQPVRLSLPGNRSARIAYGRLEILEAHTLSPTVDHMAETGALPPDVDPERLEAFPDPVYRTRRPGDRIRLTGGNKKLSDLLIDRKVPREARDRLQLLASGENVLWVEGVATDVRVAKATRNKDKDIVWMREALGEAKGAGSRGELPVGAVVVRGNAVVGRGSNRTETNSDPTGHAEMYALRDAAERLGDWRLTGCTLYVTLEPCPMCFGAALQAHLPRLVYGAPNHREGALGSVMDLRAAPWKRKVEVRSGVLAGEGSELLRGFFRTRRAGMEDD